MRKTRSNEGSRVSPNEKVVLLTLFQNESITPKDIFGSNRSQLACYYLNKLVRRGWVEKVGKRYKLSNKVGEFIAIAKRSSEITQDDEKVLKSDKEFEKALRELIVYSIILFEHVTLQDIVKAVFRISRVMDDMDKTAERRTDMKTGINTFVYDYVHSIPSDDEDVQNFVESIGKVADICRRYFRSLGSYHIVKEVIKDFKQYFTELLWNPDHRKLEKGTAEISRKLGVPEQAYLEELDKLKPFLEGIVRIFWLMGYFRGFMEAKGEF
ncbi:hypothetical protein [Archaeoglobus sp.]|uniref:hypothetical protein n=1 Tax=Archaeoglobus sp. TaxID=1872626 RepID=UPI0024AA4094|nr:hypothetical protein [Archaeoglobus sp.]MDI3498225.1 hypothetical protein [Archaeoglobus sp.]